MGVVLGSKKIHNFAEIGVVGLKGKYYISEQYRVVD